MASTWPPNNGGRLIFSRSVPWRPTRLACLCVCVFVSASGVYVCVCVFVCVVRHSFVTIVGTFSVSCAGTDICSFCLPLSLRSNAAKGIWESSRVRSGLNFAREPKLNVPVRKRRSFSCHDCKLQESSCVIWYGFSPPRGH